MDRALFMFRVLLVAATASFMAFHTVIFINGIEPNLTFAWIASLLIEGMLISLSLAKGWVRLWLIPLFITSVLAASASFVVKNEGPLESFIQGREAQEQTSQTVESLRSDLAETQKEFGLGSKYTTSTLKRERVIKDQIAQVLSTAKGQGGHLTLANSLLFLLLVLVLQGVSVSTAMTLKNGIGGSRETQNPNKEVSKFPAIVSMETTETEFTETTETWKPEKGNYGNLTTKNPEKEKNKTAILEDSGPAGFGKQEEGLDKIAIVAAVQKLKTAGATFEDLAGRFGMSKGTLSKLMQYPLYPVSDEIFQKIQTSLKTKGGDDK